MSPLQHSHTLWKVLIILIQSLDVFSLGWISSGVKKGGLGLGLEEMQVRINGAKHDEEMGPCVRGIRFLNPAGTETALNASASRFH